MSPATLLLGFAFGLRPDGSPGPVNHSLAERLRQDLANLGDDYPLLGLQWELADALGEGFGGTPLHVVPPPPITAADILDPVRFLPAIHRVNEFSGGRYPPPPEKSPGREALAAWCARLLPDRRLFAEFPPYLALRDLVRVEIGSLGIEERRRPAPADYPHGLGRYQARRINRLFLEALLAPDVLRRGRYINTRAVAERVLTAFAGRQIDEIIGYAHPLHREWCARQLGRARPPRNAGISWAETPLVWDAASAQHWCRSPAAWTAYQARIKRS